MLGVDTTECLAGRVLAVQGLISTVQSDGWAAAINVPRGAC